MIPEYSWEEVKGHNSYQSCWLVMNQSEVFDVSNFISDHPGGEEMILQHCGKDAT